MVDRFDVSTTKKWRLDKRKRLIVESTPTRAGIFTYHERGEDGKINQVKELRHPDDVFSVETLDSLNGIPYTTQENHISLMKPGDITGKTYGYTLSGAKRVDGDMAHVEIKINDGKEISAVMGKKSLELSNGYTCDIDKTPGEYKGERYDQRQINIIYDHVARVEKARGGGSCRIRLDSESAICGIEAERLDSGINSHKEENMAEKEKVIVEKPLPARVSGQDFRLDADSVSIPQEHVEHISKMLAREDKMFTALETSNLGNTEKQVKLDAQDKTIQDLEKRVENAIPAEKFDAEMDKRLKTWDLAKEYKVKDYQSMSVKDLNVKIAQESKMFNDARMDDDQYVSFCIEHLQTEQAKNVARSRKNLESGHKFDAADGSDLSKPSRLEVS